MSTAPQVRDFCLAAPTRWDEACWMVPAARALVGVGLHCGILCPVEQEQFWSQLGDTEVISYRARDWQRPLAERLAGQWRASLCWEAGFAARVLRRARIPDRLGPDEPLLRPYLTQPLPVASAGPTAHRVRRYLDVVAHLGVAHQDASWFRPLLANARAAVLPQQVLVVVDSDYGPSHEWPMEHWEVVVARLLERGQSVSIATGVGGRSLGERLLQRTNGSAGNWVCGGSSLWLERLSGFDVILSVDGSLPHVAAMAGAFCATWFGPDDPAWRRPMGREHLVLRQHVECAPCLAAKCRLDHRCMRELDGERVWQQLSAWMDRIGTRQA